MADFDGVINPAASWQDVPQLGTAALARGGAGGPMNAQALALAARDKQLQRLHFEEKARLIGCTLAAGSFEAGATITSASQLLINESDATVYRWTGAVPKSVAASSLPSEPEWVNDTERSAITDLSASGGSTLIGHKQTTVSGRLGDFLSTSDYAVVLDGGVFDNTAKLQQALNDAVVGQTVFISPGKDPANRFCKVGNFTVPTGVSLQSLGAVLWMDGATVTLSPSTAQEFNTVFRDIWFKRARFNISTTTGLISAVVFDHCFLDGTNTNNQFSVSGNCISIGERAFDVYLCNGTRICNYGGWGIDILANTDPVNLNGSALFATGVHIGLDDSTKIFNCGGLGQGGAIRMRGGALDGSSLHLGGLLDHCQYALYLDNENAVTGESAAGGGITVLADRCRIELCGKVGSGPETPVIYNRRGNVDMGTAWANTAATSDGDKLVHNVKGRFVVSGGRWSAATANAYVIYNEGNTVADYAEFDGSITRGLLYNVCRKVVTDERVARDMISMRLLITGLGGSQITAQIVDGAGETFGMPRIDKSVSAAIGLGASVSVGSGQTEMTFLLTADGQFMTLNPGRKEFAKVLLASVVRNSTGTDILVDPSVSGGGQTVTLAFRNATTGAGVNMAGIGVGAQLELAILCTMSAL